MNNQAASLFSENQLPIEFNHPAIVGNELEYILQAVQQGHIAGGGEFTKKCQGLIEAQLGVPKALLTTSCTHALEMAALLLEIKPGDEIIVPSYTFVSTVNPFVLRGAHPVFCDIRPDTLNIDESKIGGLITPKTRAIVVVHYAGVGCEMATILNIASQNGVAVIEDNAHGLFGKYDNQYLGTFGCLAAQSFHETKNITCGEGGALLINDQALVERAEILREKGTDRSRFFRGQVDKYSWVDVGSSYIPSEILAAFLYAQLESWKEIQNTRRQIWERYFERLSDWAEDNQVSLPFVPKGCEQSYHMFYMLMPSFKARQELIAHLKLHQIKSVFHYTPLHNSTMGQVFGGKDGDCPVTERVSNQLLRLPFHNLISYENVDQVVDVIKMFRNS